MNHRCFLTVIATSLLIFSCGKKQKVIDPRPGVAVVAIMSDVSHLNPIITTETIESQVNGILYPILFEEAFDMGEGRLILKPMLAKRWEFQNEGKDVVLYLRNDVTWEDGFPVTAADVKFSFGLYGNPAVASPRRNYVDGMIFTNGTFDLDKSITIINDTTLVFHFQRPYPEQLFHINLQPIARHVYRNIDPAQLASAQAGMTPVGSGPFRFVRWTRLQELVVGSNPKSVLPYPAKLDRVVFRVISDPATRLAELKKGSIDMMWPVYPENVSDVEQNHPEIKLITMPPRAYDYIGWANIDFKAWRESGRKTYVPHPLFGSKEVRQALTYGINRQGIIDGFLGQYGELAITDMSPVFRWAINYQLKPYGYDPQRARDLLRRAGWDDHNGDGILDKDGRMFEFTMHYNAGNARRAYAATIVQENLKQLGIKVHLSSTEGNVFFATLARKEYDAFLAGFSVGLAIDPGAKWGSDVSNPFNNTGFRNKRVDELVTLAHNVRTDRDEAPFWRELQAILHEEQPVTFMYWIKEVVAVNRRLHDVNPGILGTLDGIWDWTAGSGDKAE